MRVSSNPSKHKPKLLIQQISTLLLYIHPQRKRRPYLQSKSVSLMRNQNSYHDHLVVSQAAGPNPIVHFTLPMTTTSTPSPMLTLASP